MQIPVIKYLVENYSKEELQLAEEFLAEEKTPQIKIEGEDEGEQLTHAYAAIWILDKMREKDIPFNKALREFTSRVRTSIN